ncbi:polysaccharide deacetylase family protein [Mesorhizobium sp. SB112]|uniref:polysaccharide deacetylase family protein n=1 Tax=Mesorhizobium sp. SB112 TaxID=3151853 RepID=UPI0032633620
MPKIKNDRTFDMVFHLCKVLPCRQREEAVCDEEEPGCIHKLVHPQAREVRLLDKPATPKITHAPQTMTWPDGRTVAVIFNIAYEAWSDGKAPGIGPMGNPLPSGNFDENALSWGRYGSVNGINRLLRVLDRTKTRASVMVSGILAERQAAIVKSISQAGHEISAHSYAQDLIPSTLSADEDEKNIRDTTAAIEAATGARPKGWISPRGTAGAATVNRLVAAGYEWHSDVLDSDVPYSQEFPNGSIVAVPFGMEINDLPHAMRFGKTPRQFVENFNDFLEHALLTKDSTFAIEVTAHAHCYGRPGGAWAYEEIAKVCVGRDDIWLPMRGEVADHFKRHLGG